jgi:hypothetical protein
MSTPRYLLRYLFDPGAGCCLWVGDDATCERFDYPVDHAALPLTRTTQARIDATLAWYDTSLDWEYPPDPGPWPQAECDRFNATVAALYATIVAELHPAFRVRNEHRPLREEPDLDAYLADPANFRRD